jgi:hypothetical protein
MDEKFMKAFQRHLAMVTYLKLKDLRDGLEAQDLTEYGKFCMEMIERGMAALNSVDEVDVPALQEVIQFLKEMAEKVKKETTDALYTPRETPTV